MHVDKTKIFVGYVSIKSTMYIIQRKEDLQVAIDLIAANNYSESIEKFLSIVSDTIEYVVKINI